MKFIGAVVVVLYAAVAFSGWEPFGGGERNKAAVRPGGARYWTGGYMGGK